MDLEGTLLPESSWARCCDCGCTCSVMDRSLMSNWIRTVKRKFDEYDEANKLVIPDLYPNVARVAIDNECFALRDMVSRQRETIQDLTNELEKERNASSTAANEALSMILRLQSEKAETQMEFRQFKDYVEKKMAHDQQELLAMEDCLYKREQVIQSLVENLEEEHQIQYPSQEYPSLKCYPNESRVYSEEPDNEAIDVEKYACGDSLWPSIHLKDLEYRLSQLEKNPVVNHPGQDLSGTNNENDKEPRDFKSFSLDSSSSLSIMGKDQGPDFASDSSKLKTEDSNLRKVDSASELEDDRGTDIIYMVDDVKNASLVEEYCHTPEKSSYRGDDSDLELKNIYKRLHALEADRESTRQTIVSMRTDKAQLVILKEIAQQLYKDMPPARRMPVKKPSLIQNISIVSVFKKILCFVFWRKKGRRVKYMFGMSSSNNPGLPTLLDKGPLSPQWRCLLSTQV